MILADHGFIAQDDGSHGIGLEKSLDGFCQWSVLPLRLTLSGHQFIEALSNEEVWATIRHDYPNASITSLEVVALRLLEDYALNKVGREPRVKLEDRYDSLYRTRKILALAGAERFSRRSAPSSGQ